MAYTDLVRRRETRRRYRARPEQRQKNQDYMKGYRDRHLQKLYGILPGTYKTMLQKQKGLCAVCNQPETATKKGTLMALAVDHDHTTGRVRGLLCYACNRALGLFGDSVDKLQAAAAYVNGRATINGRQYKG